MNSQFIDFKIIQKLETKEVLSQCSGNNQKSIFLFYPQEDAEQLPFLKKILSAVQLDLDQDVLALAGTTTTTFSFSDIGTQQDLSKVLVFGFAPSQIGLQLQLTKYQAYTLSERQYLFADGLQQIAADQSLKGLLWKGLQEMFL